MEILFMAVAASEQLAAGSPSPRAFGTLQEMSNGLLAWHLLNTLLDALIDALIHT